MSYVIWNQIDNNNLENTDEYIMIYKNYLKNGFIDENVILELLRVIEKHIEYSQNIDNTTNPDMTEEYMIHLRYVVGLLEIHFLNDLEIAQSISKARDMLTSQIQKKYIDKKIKSEVYIINEKIEKINEKLLKIEKNKK